MQIPAACYLLFCDLLGYVNSGESAGSEMYEKLSAMYIALVFWFIHECILLPPAATYVAGLVDSLGCREFIIQIHISI